MPDGLLGPPKTDAVADFEWTGEWTVTYETFRDMGLAFMAALVLIYGLIVWEFRNFALAGLIMSPIPLTLIGIIPGHLIMGAEFTATSMIGMIALGGIIVRQSILIVEFVKIEVGRGKRVREAAVAGAEIRMRPILITSLTLMAGAWAIINDPIFQGMAVSLLFGAGVATLMAVIVIPLGCISLRRQFYLQETESGEIALSSRYELIELGAAGATAAQRPEREEPAAGSAIPLWLRLWSALVSVVLVLVRWVGLVFRLPGALANGIVRAKRRVFARRAGASVRTASSSKVKARPQQSSRSAADARVKQGTTTAEAASEASVDGDMNTDSDTDVGGGLSPEPAARPVAGAQRRSAARKTAVRKTAAKKATTKAAAARTGATKKAAAKKTATKKVSSSKAGTKKAPARRQATKKTPAKPDDRS